MVTEFSVLGPYIGSIVSFPLSAVLCQYGFDGGWPSVFYVFGKLPTAFLSLLWPYGRHWRID